jgi:Ceramidase
VIAAPLPLCPWQRFEPANLDFCERQLCAWVTEPANTWSNLGFFLTGALVLWWARRDGAARAGLFGVVALLTGFGSTALHATSTFIGQALDQGSMFLESGLFVVLNVARLWHPKRSNLVLSYLALVAPSITLLLYFETIGIALFVVEVVIFVALEARLALRDYRTTRYGPLAGVGVTFVLSYALWWLDHLRILCDPDNHIFTAHSAWHLLGALSFLFWYRHFAQFDRAQPQTSALSSLVPG